MNHYFKLKNVATPALSHSEGLNFSPESKYKYIMKLVDFPVESKVPYRTIVLYSGH